MVYHADQFFASQTCPCPMHLAVNGEIIPCVVQLSSTGHPFIRCESCHSITFINAPPGELLLKQLITVYHEAQQEV